MPSKRNSFDLDNLCERYEAGESMVGLSRSLGVAPMTIRAWLESRGVPIRGLSDAGRLERTPLDLNELRARHERGESVFAIARAMGTSRTVIEPRLREMGITPRSKKEAHQLRLDRIGAAGRRALTAEMGSRLRVRNPREEASAPLNRASALVIALGKTRCVGNGEPELYDLLIARGLDVEPQTALYGYNLDFSVGRVAVEVWWGKGYPFRQPRSLRKAVDLGNLGWSTIFVWCSGRLPTAGGADAVVSFIEETGGSPDPVRPQYRVVRSDGEFVTGGEAELDKIALVPPTHRSTQSRK